MKELQVKLWLWLNVIGVFLLITSIPVLTQTEYKAFASFIFMFALSAIVFSYFSASFIGKLAKSEDEISKKWIEVNQTQEELDKLIDFTKRKIFSSTVVSKKEICEYMGWEYKEGN